VAEAAAHSPLHEPYETYARQKEATAFGMWVFLASEILLFGGLFLAYAVYRWTQTDAFAAAARHTNELLGGLNTVWMLSTSAAMAVAARALPVGRTRLSVAMLLATLVFALLFVGTKSLEYADDLREHLWPAPGFALAEPAARTFYGLYWVMTGLHAVHVVIGAALVVRLLVLARARRLPERTDSLEATALYWGLVDAVWIVLFPCLYLIGR
jgi:cytochrome c oxidase subunit III